MVITSYHPIYTFYSQRESRGGYHNFHLRKTLEINILWYFYIRNFFGPDCDILIIDQNSDYSIQEFLNRVKEPYDISDVKDFSYDKNLKLHIKQFHTKRLICGGCKRMYHYCYKFCHFNNLDFFFVENDCIVARNLLEECRNIDFATNNIDQKHRVCDTWINFISKSRLKEHDVLMPLDKFYDSIVEKYDREEMGSHEVFSHDIVTDRIDVASTIMNERGAYMKYCYGDILTFNNDRVFHGESNDKLIKFLKENKINHPYYDYFLENAERIDCK